MLFLKIDIAVKLRIKADFPSFGDDLTLQQFPFAEIGDKAISGMEANQRTCSPTLRAIPRMVAIFEDTNRDMRDVQSLILFENKF